ncbi:helix-turn-helix domain-containing protein [Streptomyces sp. NPDC046557]|uniref:helix-turn-helix domain-containing protein n=1 Tax=Streptomyces sp. NPDC046557 TaxID=3155372 RepID=UPI0033F30578
MSKYADFEGLRTQAVALRRDGFSRREIRDRLQVFNGEILNRLLQGEAAPEWTRRPNAKDDLRDRARALRLQGLTYDQIQTELGCSKSSVSLWVRDLPKVDHRTPQEQGRDAALKRWAFEGPRREAAREASIDAARAAVGGLSDRELFLIGAALYWAEGSKSKPYRRSETATFINSDPGVIRVYLAWLSLLGITPERLRFRVMIHETADVAGAELYWADFVGVQRSQLQRTTLKKHNPKTVRKNTGTDYRGCLIVRVSASCDLYRRIEGTWCGIVGAVDSIDRGECPI